MDLTDAQIDAVRAALNAAGAVLGDCCAAPDIRISATTVYLPHDPNIGADVTRLAVVLCARCSHVRLYQLATLLPETL